MPTLAEILDSFAADLLSFMQRCVDHGLVVEEADIPLRFRFRHALIRKALADRLVLALAAPLHGDRRRIANAPVFARSVRTLAPRRGLARAAGEGRLMAFHIWLANVPVWIVLLLFAAVPAAIFCVIHYYFRRIVSGDKLIRHHDVAGFLVGIAGVIYAVVLGFIVVTVWVNFDSAQRTADLEASDVAELVGFAGVLPEPAKSELRRSMADYAFEVRDREWPMLVSDRQDMNARDFYGEALPVITSLPGVTPHSFAEALKGLAVQQSALSVLHDLSVHRRERLITAGSGLPFGLYVALVLGALIVLAFVFLFGVDNCVLQLTMTGLIAALIGLLLGVIVCLDRPYSGGIRVSPDAWTLVIDNNHLEEYRTPRSR